jgi:hypothetical protein
MSEGIRVVAEMVLEAVLIFLLLGCLFGLVYGVGLLLRQKWVFALNERTKRWVSTRQALRAFDVPRFLEGYVYKASTLIGLVLVTASAYVLFELLIAQDEMSFVALFFARPGAWAEIVLRTVRWVLLTGAVAGVVVGLLLAVNPRAMRSLEARANRSYSMRQRTRVLEVMNYAPDEWTASSPLLAGGLITVGSLYAAFVLGMFLLARM